MFDGYTFAKETRQEKGGRAFRILRCDNFIQFKDTGPGKGRGGESESDAEVQKGGCVCTP